MHRSRKAAINTAIGLIEEIVSLVCAFILPRLIITAFGSSYNGLTTSISQFLSCAILLRSGIGGATRAALYKPLAEHNKEEFDSIVKATDIFMKKIGAILLGAILIFAIVYPLLVKNEFGWLFSCSLFIIIGMSTFAESFFGITYLIVLQADQKVWISSLFKCICIILNTVIGAILILNHFSIHIVKLGSAIIFVLYPIVLGAYVKHHYKINKHVKPNNKAIEQRWDAFWQQVALFVMNNTDVIVLTVFSNMLEVSVYSVYNTVMSGLKKTMQSFTNGLEAAFGNMIAKKEEKNLRINLSVTETMIYGISTFIYTCAVILILDFVKLYTHNVNDVNYMRPLFAYLIIAAQFFNGIRIPYQLIVQAAGHYKQTKTGAIIEPIINILISIIFVFKFGLVGVAVGTLVATVFRTIQYSLYISKHLIKRSWTIVVLRVVISFFEAAITILVMRFINLPVPHGFVQWIINAIITAIISFVFVVSGSFIFFRTDSINLFKKTIRIFNINAFKNLS